MVELRGDSRRGGGNKTKKNKKKRKRVRETERGERQENKKREIIEEGGGLQQVPLLEPGGWPAPEICLAFYGRMPTRAFHSPLGPNGQHPHKSSLHFRT